VNVLFVEDYGLGAALVRDTLKRLAPDIHLEIVPTVALALARLNLFEKGGDGAPIYEVVLTDLNLPDGLGLEILSHVRSRKLELAVVILTGSGKEDTVIAALHAGANDYVTKRDDYLAALPRTLRTALERFRSELARASTPLKVLYADADAADVERVRGVLCRSAPNIVIDVAQTTDEVLTRLRTALSFGDAPQVMLLDDRLPGMPIVELLKAVENLTGLDLPVVLVTAAGDERIAQLAIRLGVADYLNKSEGYLQRLPFTLERAQLRAASVREREALRKSEGEFRALVNNLPDVVIRFDRAGRCLYVSPAVEAMRGWVASFYIGKTQAELGMPTEVVQRFDGAIQRVFATGERQKIEYEIEGQAGLQTFEAVLAPERGADGRVKSVLTIARDITERQRARAALRDSELLARSTVDALSAHVAIMDETGTIIAVNRAWRTFATANPATGSRVFEGANYLSTCDAAVESSPETAVMVGGLRAVMRGELAEFSLDYPCHSPQQQRWFNLRVTRCPSEGSARVVVAHENITERKIAEAALRESQEQFTAFFENAIDAILVTTPDGCVCLANPSACAMFQRSEAELISGGRGVIMNMHDARLESALREREATGKFRGELSFVRRDGSCFEGELTSVIYVDRRSMERTCVIIRDITERRHAEARVAHYRDHLEEQVAARTDELARANQALTEARDAADSANRAKTSFLANMSHEIRTPMSAIIGLARLMRTDLTRTDASRDRPLDYLGKLQGAADHLLRIINDVLDLTKIEADQLTLEDAEFSLRQMLMHAIDMLQDRAAEKALTLDLFIDARMPALLRGDGLRVEQIVLNFLGNAIKFAARGSIYVRANVVEAGANETLLRIEVEDAGIGMTPEQQTRLFQPFSQADSSISRQFGGTGLGLVIARRLAGLMQGEVGVISQAAAGSTFWMVVRLRNGRSVPGAVEPAVTAPPITRFDGVRVLVAEDDPVNQIVTSETLKQMGFEVDVVGNGAEAVERIRAGDYALLLMDIQMPVMDGLTATRAIRALPGLPSLPIVAMTANAFADDQRRCIDAGMDDFVSKPIRPDDFYRTLVRVLASGSGSGRP